MISGGSIIRRQGKQRIFFALHAPQRRLALPAPLGVGASKDEIYRMIGGNIAELCRLNV